MLYLRHKGRGEGRRIYFIRKKSDGECMEEKRMELLGEGKKVSKVS